MPTLLLNRSQVELLLDPLALLAPLRSAFKVV
jgi:hypothetical protein